MYSITRGASYTFVIGLLAVAFLMAGCDSAMEDSITLQPKTITFEFPNFTDEDVEDGTIELSAESPKDLSDQLRNDGFERGDVVGATISETELVRIGPLQQAKLLPFLNEAELRLNAPGQSSITIGTRTGFNPDESTTSLNTTDQDVADFVRAESMDADLTLRVEDIDDAPPRVNARVTFVVEVEGV